MTSPRPLVGISSCLLGERVRFDGGHKKDDWLVKELGKWVEWEPWCPEMQMGLGSPRESLRLVARGKQNRLVGNRTGKDVTAAAKTTAREIVTKLGDLDGYILKKNSPSCGLERVKVYGKNDIPFRAGQGVFAERLQRAMPLLPMIEEGRLSDPEQREQFVTRVFAFYRWKKVPAKISAIQKFHQEYKLLLMAHSPSKYQALGKIAANPSKRAPSDVKAEYGPVFLGALADPSTTKKRVNVLQHIFGYFKREIPPKEKAGILEAIEEFRKGELSFLAALTCVRQLLNRVSVPYLESQLFFDPYPKALSLRRYL